MIENINQLITGWIIEAGHELKKSLNKTLKVEEKKNERDLVTEMDKKTEAFFVEKIRSYFPDHKILAEEGLADDVTSLDGIVWVIDPIDGTLNFVKMKDQFGIMLAIYENGQPLVGYIYDVIGENLYCGIVGEGVYINGEPYSPQEAVPLEESLIAANINCIMDNKYNQQRLLNKCLGVRSFGSACNGIISVLLGQTSLYFSSTLMPWDVGAGLAIMESIGYPVTRADGSPVNLLEAGPVIFSNPLAHKQVIEIINK